MSCHENDIYEEAKREDEEENKIRISVKGKADSQEFSDYNEAIQFLNAMWEKELEEEEMKEVQKDLAFLGA